MIGYSDVKSTPVYFYVQKNMSQLALGVVPFELTRLNIGGAIDVGSGIFTAPRDGVYSFQFSAVAYYPASSSRSDVMFSLIMNDNEIGRSLVASNDDSSVYTHSLQSTLDLKMGDRVWINLHYVSPGAYLCEDAGSHYTHFTGHLWQEKVASSYNLLSQ